MSSRRRRAWPLRRRLLFAALTTGLFLGALEIAARLGGWAALPAESVFDDVYAVDYRMLPNAQTPWGGVDEFLNRDGFRGRDINPSRPAGVLRILSLGDSTTYGAFVENEETYTFRLAEELRRRGVAAETINAGMPGSTLWGQVALFDKQFRDYDLDLVILYTNYGYRRDFLELRRFMENHRTRLAVRRGLSRLHLYRFLRRWLKPPHFELRLDQYADAPFAGANADREVRALVAPYMEQDLRHLDAQCRAKGARLLVVPLLAQLPFKTATAQQLRPGDLNWHLYHRANNGAVLIGETARRLGIPTLLAEDEFLAAAYRQALFLDDCHFSPAGHALMAQALARGICEQDLLPVACRPVE